MSENNSPKGYSYLKSLFLILMFYVLGFFIFFITPSPLPLDLTKTSYQPRPLSVEKNITLKDAVRIGQQDMEHENLILQIRQNLQITKELEIKILIGRYSNMSGEGVIIPSNHPFGFILLFDEFFYQSLTPEEKIAAISHELGHLTNEEVIMMLNSDTRIQFQIEADTYSTKYARPEVMISVIKKLQAKTMGTEASFREYTLRIQNLEKIKQDY